MVRPRKDSKEGQLATKRWRETMENKYGGASKKMAEIGAIGGKNGRGENYKGGFASNKELAKKCGSLGGLISVRGKGKTSGWEEKKSEILKLYNDGKSYKEISKITGLSYGSLLYRLKKYLEMVDD